MRSERVPSKHRISATALQRQDADLLGTPARSAALQVSRRGINRGRIIEYGQSLYRADRLQQMQIQAVERVGDNRDDSTRRWGRIALPRMLSGALGGIRTPNLLIRSQVLYPLSYERSEADRRV